MKWRVAANKWTLKELPWSEAIPIEDVSDDRLAVPEIVCYMTRGEDAEMNATLVAAAPDLLEALENLIDWLEDVPLGPESARAKRIALDAIARARGE